MLPRRRARLDAYAGPMHPRTILARWGPLILAVAAIIGIWSLPETAGPGIDLGLSPVEAWRGQVVDPAPGPSDPSDELSGYGEVLVRLSEGPLAGEELRAFVTLQSTDASPEDFRVGDEVIVSFTDDAEGKPFASVSERWRLPLLSALVLLFVIVMVVVGGWQGVRALVALGFTIVLVIRVFVPSLVAGVAPVPMAVAIAAVVTVTAILITEGFGRISTAAILGTIGGLLVTAAISVVISLAGAFGGTPAGDLAFVTFESGQSLDVRGVLLAAIILGAVGVLDDVTVSQAATVAELADGAPVGPRALWESAMRIGRSHIAATTNTLFMAYVGASLPALVLLLLAAQPATLALNREVLALEVVRTLAGSIGIILAMPLTTLIAAAIFGTRAGPVRTTR
jgi:uncharacterized membrane protein